MDRESDGDTNCNRCARYSHHRIGKETGGLGNKRTSGDHPNYSFIKIGKNTEKCPGDLWRFTITQILVKNHHLTLERKTLKWSYNNTYYCIEIFEKFFKLFGCTCEGNTCKSNTWVQLCSQTVWIKSTLMTCYQLASNSGHPQDFIKSLFFKNFKWVLKRIFKIIDML